MRDPSASIQTESGIPCVVSVDDYVHRRSRRLSRRLEIPVTSVLEYANNGAGHFANRIDYFEFDDVRETGSFRQIDERSREFASMAILEYEMSRRETFMIYAATFAGRQVVPGAMAGLPPSVEPSLLFFYQIVHRRNAPKEHLDMALKLEAALKCVEDIRLQYLRAIGDSLPDFSSLMPVDLGGRNQARAALQGQSQPF